MCYSTQSQTFSPTKHPLSSVHQRNITLKEWQQQIYPFEYGHRIFHLEMNGDLGRVNLLLDIIEMQCLLVDIV